MAWTKSGPEQSRCLRRRRTFGRNSGFAAAFRRLIVDESGSNGVEYAVLLTMVGAALVGVLAFAGGSLNDLFGGIGGAIPEIPPAEPAPAG